MTSSHFRYTNKHFAFFHKNEYDFFFDGSLTHFAHLLMANQTYLFYSCQRRGFWYATTKVQFFILFDVKFFSLLFLFIFLILIFDLKKWIKRISSLNSTSIITWTLRFKIDCSYQNGIRVICIFLLHPNHQQRFIFKLNFFMYFFSLSLFW